LDSGARRVLDTDEQREFLRAVEHHLSARDRAIAHSLFYTGLRVAELVSLDLPDVLLTPDRGRLVVPGREMPLDPHPRPSLQDWLSERGRWADAGRTEAVFVNQRGGRLTSRSVDHVVVQAGAAAGIDAKVTPQVLRRTFAHRLLRQGTAIEQVARLMGHARLDTTRRYATAEATDADS
jgi:integrase/recombinase XerC